jgi:protocatechuate 3,4-dioxygenase beta subunit
MIKLKPYNSRDWKSHPPYTFKAYGSSVNRGPLKKLVPIKQTLSEVTGPLFSDIKLEPGENDLTRDPVTGKEALGERIIVVGKVMDEMSGRCRIRFSKSGRPMPRGAIIIRWTSTTRRSIPTLSERAGA